ncbi:hypothetical protein R5R35_009519 [Gryllus longicercus]
MERWRGRVAVVTGASAGIGAAIAYQFQDAGLTVVALARRKEKIPVAVEEARREAKERGRATLGKAPSPGKLHALKCDVSNEEDILAAFKWVKDNLGGVDILVNNAGVPGGSSLTGPNVEEWKRILNVNLLGLCICTREAVQQMKERGVDDGHIIHISSRAGHYIFGVPGIHMYSASKHGVRVVTEGLRKELVAAKSRIRVTEVSPGLVKTEIFDKIDKNTASLDAVTASLGASEGEGVWALPHVFSEDVADAVLYAVSTPPHVQIHEMIVMPVGEAV